MLSMKDVEPVQLNLKSRFRFRCHKDISCFTKCCSKIDILLTPYDIVVLKKRLNLTSDDFLEKYTYIQADDKGVFPLVYLKMKEDEASTCPFVTADGCTIYEDRPANCRYYAVGQGTLKKQFEDRLIDEEFYFLVKEKHCRGFEEEKEWTIGEWRENQGVDKYDELNREWKRILLIKNTPGLQINDEKQAGSLSVSRVRAIRYSLRAASAAPMMPASLNCWAGTIGVSTVSSGRKLSCSLLMPPPTMNRSGQKSFSRVIR